MESNELQKLIDQIGKQSKVWSDAFSLLNSPIQRLLDQQSVSLVDTSSAQQKVWREMIEKISFPQSQYELFSQQIAQFAELPKLAQLEGLQGLMNYSSEYESARARLGQFSSIQSYHVESSALSEAINRLTLPVADIDSTLLGLSGIKNLGLALNRLELFDDKTAELIRPQLGDWRFVQDIPSNLLLNETERTSFYLARGFNSNLGTLPKQTFYDATKIAQIRSEETEQSGDTFRDDSEEGFGRSNSAHLKIVEFERKIRKFINEKMTASFGADWPHKRLPNEILSHWLQGKASADRHHNSSVELIEYSDFSHYLTIIVRKENWTEVFMQYFKRKETVHESFFRLFPVRNCVMHARPINQDDELYLLAETRRLLKAIGH